MLSACGDTPFFDRFIRHLVRTKPKVRGGDWGLMLQTPSVADILLGRPTVGQLIESGAPRDTGLGLHARTGVVGII